MYSILIVDDEEPVLESYTFMIGSREDQFSLAGTARSGSEALSVAQRSRPDIVIMDIAMPGLDGLDTIKELQKAFPETLYILSTAYERFDLAQRAIPLGVFAYMVKPVSRKRFLETLQDAASHLDQRQEGLSRRLEEVMTSAETLRREEENFLLLTTWQSLEENEWQRYRRLFRFSSDLGRIMFLEVETADRQERSGYYPGVIQVIQRRYRCLATEYLGRLLIYLPATEDVQQLERYLPGALKDVLPRDTPWRSGTGSCRPYHELYLSCAEALAAFPLHSGEQEVHQRHREVKELRRNVARAGTFDQGYAPCAAYWNGVFHENPFPVARARMVALFTLLIDDLLVRSGEAALLSLGGDPAVEIASLHSRHEWDAWAGRMLRMIIDAGNAGRKELPVPLLRAVDHIRGHYTEPLQLSRIAELAGVSPGYLSRLFPEHLDATFNDYLNSIRLDRAEELLIENRLSVKEIARATGYQDPNYFSRIFKKFKGQSPSAYHGRSTDDED